MKETKGELINKIATIILVALLVLVPLVTIPKVRFDLPRSIIIQTCGLGLLILIPFKIKDFKIDKTDICIIIFAILAILSLAFSSRKDISLFGTRERYEGIITIFIYILVYFHAKYSFIKFKHFKTILLVIYLAICTLGIFQYYIPASWRIPFMKGRVNLTFGNTNFVGCFVSLVIPVLMFKYITEGKIRYIFFNAIAFLVMIMCGARSLWVAFIMCVIGLIIYVIKKKDKIKLIRFGTLIITLIACLLFIKITTFNDTWVDSRFDLVFNEIEALTSEGLKDHMGSGRVIIWKMTLEVIAKKPILGCGVDNLYFGMVECTPQELLEFINEYKVYIDKAHNEFLHIAATMGIPALIAYIGFIGSIMTKNFKNCFKEDTNMLYVLIIGSYITQAFFNISVIGVAPIFWFALGMAARNAKEKQNNKTKKEVG